MIFVTAGLLVGGLLFLTHVQTTSAAADITPEVIERIKSRCTENSATLNRLHKTDASIRTDRGNLYRTISDKLMVPLNRRLAANQQDASGLLTITSNYNDEFTKFSKAYVDYDNSLAKVLDIDCSKEPVAFYSALTDARAKRTALSVNNQRIKEYIREYGTTFTSLKQKFEQENS